MRYVPLLSPALLKCLILNRLPRSVRKTECGRRFCFAVQFLRR